MNLLNLPPPFGPAMPTPPLVSAWLSERGRGGVGERERKGREGWERGRESGGGEGWRGDASS